MGFERLVAVLQDQQSNYDTDVFAPLLDAIEALGPVGLAPYGGKLGAADVGLKDTAYRIIADHARTLSFAIADGALPSVSDYAAGCAASDGHEPTRQRKSQEKATRE
jgi:alanyl-tRNA synthetase